MQPTELKLLIEEAVRQGTSYPWWALLASLIGAAAGAYVISYLTKKGEARATRESFDQLREQLRMTTKDTEEIKELLSSKAWRSQKQWSALEQYYSNLLTNLHKFKLALSDVSDYYMEPGSEHTPDSKQGQHFHDLLKSSYASYKELQLLIGPAALYLSSKSLKALDELESQHWNLANFSECTADYVAAAHTLASAAYEAILFEAKGQLNLEQRDA